MYDGNHAVSAIDFRKTATSYQIEILDKIKTLAEKERKLVDKMRREPSTSFGSLSLEELATSDYYSNAKEGLLKIKRGIRYWLEEANKNGMKNIYMVKQGLEDYQAYSPQRIEFVD